MGQHQFTEEEHQRFFWMVAESGEDRIDPRTGKRMGESDEVSRAVLMKQYEEDRKKFDSAFVQRCLEACPLLPMVKEILSILSNSLDEKWRSRNGIRFWLGPHGLGMVQTDDMFGDCFMDFKNGFVYTWPTTDDDHEDSNKITLSEWQSDLKAMLPIISSGGWGCMTHVPKWYVSSRNEAEMYWTSKWPRSMVRRMHMGTLASVHVLPSDETEVQFWDISNDGDLW